MGLERYLATYLLLQTSRITAFSPFNARLVWKESRRKTCHADAIICRTRTCLNAMETLVFRGDYVSTTENLPEGTTKHEIAAFLAKPANRNIFMSAGGTRTTTTLEMTPQFKGFWENVCAHFESNALPNDNDTLVAVETEVKFPGMKLVTTAVSGIKEIYNDDKHPTLKGLEMLLVAEKAEAKGAGPVVWLFNKLTGYDKREVGAFYPPTQTKARSIVASQELPDSSLALSFKLNMKVTLEFPAVLVKILPSSKDKMQEQGSASILKAVSKDIETAMQAAYDKFTKERSTSVETSA